MFSAYTDCNFQMCYNANTLFIYRKPGILNNNRPISVIPSYSSMWVASLHSLLLDSSLPSETQYALGIGEDPRSQFINGQSCLPWPCELPTYCWQSDQDHDPDWMDQHRFLASRFRTKEEGCVPSFSSIRSVVPDISCSVGLCGHDYTNGRHLETVNKIETAVHSWIYQLGPVVFACFKNRYHRIV